LDNRPNGHTHHGKVSKKKVYQPTLLIYYLHINVGKGDTFNVRVIDGDVHVELHIGRGTVQIELRSTLDAAEFDGGFLE
jgi:hypothetical protein